MQIEEDYQKTLDYLYSFVDFSLTRGMRYTPEQFDLGRMVALVEALGHPERAYPSIHIAGTKGKGSVSAMCSAALQAAGYRVGLYTSPHLHDYAERIQVNGQPMPHADLVSLVDEIKPIIASIPRLTTFEITTGLAFLYFARQKVEAAVLEVGLGGRLDATNVVTPAVAVITSLSYDHMHILGNTLSEIAAEKGGIIKPGVPVVLSPQKEEARQVIERLAAERAAPLTQIGKDYLYTSLEKSLQGQSLAVWPVGNAKRRVPLSIPLLGQHQVENAATAYVALKTFARQALPLKDEAIQRGFRRTVWPGRFEVLQRQPPVVIDSAHNRDSALRLRQTLDEYFPNLPLVLIFGASEDKDIEGMMAELAPRVSQVVATRSFHPRAIEPQYLLDVAEKYGKPAQVISDVPQALEEALRLAASLAPPAGMGGMVLATGSIFIVAGVREAWLARQAQSGQTAETASVRKTGIKV